MSLSHCYALELAYDGGAYHGFAAQKDPEITTIQELVEKALKTALRLKSPVQTTCAGRTDAGVHAASQMLSFQLECEITDPALLLRSLNAITPDDLVFKKIKSVPQDFSARFDATMREYRYRLFLSPEPSLFNRAYCWHRRSQLDLKAMEKGASLLIGEHDFRSFCSASSAKLEKTTRRRIHRIEILTENFYGEDLTVLQIRGNAFLHSMVRIITGTLVEVGEGKRHPADISLVLAAKDRQAAEIGRAHV
jgi:tRNA pseudouridine38-40 synthase